MAPMFLTLMLDALSIIVVMVCVMRLMRMTHLSSWSIRISYILVALGALSYLLAPLFMIERQTPTLFYLLGLITLVLTDRRSRLREQHGHKEQGKVA